MSDSPDSRKGRQARPAGRREHALEVRMKYHITAFFLGFIMDLLIGDPQGFPHPVRLMGWLTGRLERLLFVEREKTRPERLSKAGLSVRKKKELRRGAVLAALVPVASFLVSASLLGAAYLLHPLLGLAVEAGMTWQILAVKSLRVESMKVYRCLKKGSLPEARAAVSMIVGRDTDRLDEEGVAKAAVETVAENTSDGVIAPMLYTAAGGPALGFLYKAVNTMDSMIGYKNDRYLYFGRAAAKLDDAVNFIPARISALLMIAAAFIGGKDFSAKGAFAIFKRDRKNHASPNSAQTESVCAGALGVRLAGDASYFGKIVHKPWIGDAGRSVEDEDIRRVCRLLYLTAFLGEALCLGVLLLLFRIFRSVF